MELEEFEKCGGCMDVRTSCALPVRNPDSHLGAVEWDQPRVPRDYCGFRIPRVGQNNNDFLTDAEILDGEV